jgi:hypothetical protein
LAAGILVGVATPRDASACGGTFCDTGPRAMPVDQTGENIIFVMEPGKVEAHIQIQYKGEPDKFSWILPVQAPAMAIPEVEVGSEALFDTLLQATRPSYSVTTQRDACGAVSSTFTGSTGTGGFNVGTSGSGGSGPGSGPTVVFQKAVGAFNVTILSGGTTPEVIQWLTDNQYQVPPNASTLLDGYVHDKFMFVAVKLTGGAGINEIHPLVVRYPGTNPCVPLKLTSVAAIEDMGVRTFFLGNQRVVPKNYKHVVPNLAKLDWLNASTSYAELVGRAVDSPLANGQAWITEYAGPAAIIGANSRIASPAWNAKPFETSAAVGVVQLLQDQGLANCSNGPIGTSGAGGAPSVYGGCSYSHPLLLPLLRQYIPAPSMLTVKGNVLVDPVLIEANFYSCLACYQDKIDQTKWKPLEFATDLAKRIIDPARHADAVLSAWPYLTRLFTTMSPVEMTQDPEFLERQGLGNVPVIRLSATQRITCQNQSGMTLPGGRMVALTAQQGWPRFADTMPWAEKVEEIQATGDPVVLADNTATIDGQLKVWNDSQMWPPPGTTGAGGGTVGTGSAGAAGGGNDLAATGDSGCGCRTVSSRTSGAAPWTLAGLLALGRVIARRRRT